MCVFVCVYVCVCVCVCVCVMGVPLVTGPGDHWDHSGRCCEGGESGTLPAF